MPRKKSKLEKDEAGELIKELLSILEDVNDRLMRLQKTCLEAQVKMVELRAEIELERRGK